MSHNAVAVGEDEEGELLFYALSPQDYLGNGSRILIYDREGYLMKGAHEITQYNPYSKPVVMKRPGSSTQYYLFTIGDDKKPYYHLVDLNLPGFGSAADPMGEVLSYDQAMDNGTSWDYGRHFAVLEDQVNGKHFVYLTRYIPPVNSISMGTTEILAYEFDGSGNVPQAAVVASVPGFDLKGEGELQVSPDGKQLVHYNRKLHVMGFAHREAEVNVMDLTQDKKGITALTAFAGNGAGTWGKSSVDFSNAVSTTYYNQRGIYKQPLTLSEKNTWELTGGTATLVETTEYGDLRLGRDGYLHIAGVNNETEMTSVEEGVLTVSANGLFSPVDYKLTSYLPGQSFRVRGSGGSLFTRSPGDRDYEMKDHLNNIRAIVSARRGAEINALDELENFTVISFYADYYPFGQMMSGRNVTGDGYRIGFGSMEMDNEVRGKTGASYSTFFRQYNPQIGRWMSTDPEVQPWQSTYTAFDNNPIFFIDPMGDKVNIGALWAKIKHNIKVGYSKVTGGTVPVTTPTPKGGGLLANKGGKVKGGGGLGKGRGIPGGNPSGGVAGGNPINVLEPIKKMIPRGPSFLSTPDIPNNLKDRPEPPSFSRPDPDPNPFIPPPGGQPIRFDRRIRFQRNSNTPADEPQLQQQLQPLADALNDNPTATILILGNVFNRSMIQGNTPQVLNQNVIMNGSRTQVRNLMNARAREVANQLIRMGVGPSQILFGPGSVMNTASGLDVNFTIRNPAPVNNNGN